MNTNIGALIVFKIVFWIWPFYRVRVHHGANVPRTGPLIIVSKHQRYLDILILTTSVAFREIRYMAKKSLFKNRFFAWILKSAGAFPVTQNSADKTAMKKAGWYLSKGEVLGIFGEGTRREGDIVGEIQPGLTLAIRLSRVKCQLIPCGIHYGHKSRVLTVNVCFGLPFTLEECGQTETEILASIRQRLQNAQDEAKNASEAKE